MSLFKIAKENIEIYDNGYYVNGMGNSIDITNDLKYCIDNTILIENNVQLLKNNNSKYKIEITAETAFDAGQRLLEKGKVCILNFASGIEVGGGYLRGARAQEENLCRLSCLYNCLKPNEKFYKNNKKTYPICSDDILLHPDVIFIRNEYFAFLDYPIKLSVLTCPAPNLSSPNLTKELLNKVPEIIIKRVYKILSVMSNYGYKNIVLGAWGCGAFKNDPGFISNVFKFILKNNNFNFDNIVFPIPDVNSNNHISFLRTFNETN